MAQDQVRIWYQSFVHPTEQAPYIERLQALLDGVASPASASRFTVSIRPIAFSIR